MILVSETTEVKQKGERRSGGVEAEKECQGASSVSQFGYGYYGRTSQSPNP